MKDIYYKTYNPFFKEWQVYCLREGILYKYMPKDFYWHKRERAKIPKEFKEIEYRFLKQLNIPLMEV